MRFFAICLLVLGLTGCAGAYTNQAQNQLRTAANAEKAAWEKAAAIHEKTCPHSTEKEILPKSRAVEAYECWAKVIRYQVGAVAMYPDIFNEYLTENYELAINYKKGEYDRDEVKLKQEKLWNEYAAAIDARINGVLQQAWHTDQANSQRMSQQMYTTGQALMKASEPPQRTRTSCTETLMGFDCTTRN